MIAFASLFLGLILGVQNVQLIVGDQVASVSVFLDGERIGELQRRPWELEIDLGRRLSPHELVAIAYDKKGVEVARARQMINLPRGLAEAGIVLEGGSGGVGRIARVTWQSVTSAVPKSYRITFDGQPLGVPDPRRFELPRHVPERLHFLRVELEFPESVSAVAEVTFGGKNPDQVFTELTAVPVNLAKLKKLPSPEAMDGWFLTRNGEEAKAVAVEEGVAEVIAVMDLKARADLDSLSASLARASVFGTIGFAERLRGSLSLKKGQTFQFLWPYPIRRDQPGTHYILFPHTPPYMKNDGGFLWILSRAASPAVREPPMLFDALAVAGLQVAERNRCRAVVLVLSDADDDQSRLTAEEARYYLSQLRVPVFVWSVSTQKTQVPRATKATSWLGPEGAEVTDVSTLGRLEDAVSRLSKYLERQRIVWVAGNHLPQSIGLSPKADGIALAN